MIFLNLLIKPVWIFFIDRQVQNIVGYETYGIYFALLNLSYMLLFLADAGLSSMLNQRLANKELVNARQLLKVKLTLLIIYSVVCFFVAWITHVTQWSFVLYIVLIQALTSLFVFLRSLITANQYFTADAWFSIIDKLLMVLICGCIIYGSLSSHMTLQLFLQIQLSCTVLAVFAALFFILREKLFIVNGAEDIDMMIKKVLPFAMIILLMSLHYRLDGFLLERIHYNGPYEAGVYASAYRLLDAANMVGYLAASFLVPFIARHLEDKGVIEDAINTTRHGLIFMAIGLVSFTVVFGSWIQRILYHSTNEYNTLVIQLCIATLPGYFLVHIYGSALTAMARFRSFITILILSVLLNGILNIELIPAYGALGCCIAALASQYFCGVVCYIVAAKALAIPFKNRSNLIYIISVGVLTVFFYIGRTMVNNVWIILAIVVCIMLVLLISQIRHIKKYFISLR